MGGLKNAMRDQRRATAFPDLFAGRQGITEPGDPDFSLAETPGSQLQFPAAAAQGRVLDVRTRAQNQLAEAVLAGADVTAKEFDELRQAAQEGVVDVKPTLGESILGWVGGPFEAVNAAIQDLTNVVQGKEAAGLSLWDYGRILFSGVEDDDAFQDQYGLRPESFSETLTMFGWAPDESEGVTAEKILRGVVDFTGGMLIDPLSYVTGGMAGLGRRAGVAAGRALDSKVTSSVMKVIGNGENFDGISRNVSRAVLNQADDLSDYARHLALTNEQTLVDFEQVLAKNYNDIIAQNPNSPVVRDLMSYMGGKGSTYEDVVRNFQELALHHRITSEVTRPLSQRNFGAINDLARTELPLWARGGVRIALPSFSPKLAAFGTEIPGTRGLGRKLIGEPLREISKSLKELSPRYKRMADALSSGRVSFDAYRPIMNGLRSGEIQPWQFHISAASIDNIHNQLHRHMTTATLTHLTTTLEEAGHAAGMERDELWRFVREGLEQSSDEGVLMREAEKLIDSVQGTTMTIPDSQISRVPEAVQKAADDSIMFIRKTYDELHSAMSALDPKFKERYIDGYVSHIFADDGRNIINDFVRQGANIPFNEWADAADRGEQGKGLLAHLMNAVGSSGRLETELGSNRWLDRKVGRLQAQLLVDDGPVMLSESSVADKILRSRAQAPVGPGGEVFEETLETRYMGIGRLNELLEPVIRENAEKYGIHLPRNWDGKLFKENPFEIAAEYTAAMDDTINQWSMIRAMRQAGLITPHSVALDVQDVLQNMMANIKRIAEKTPVDQDVSAQVAKEIKQEILDAPDDFIYQGTIRKRGDVITGRKEGEAGVLGGGIASTPGRAEDFARAKAVELGVGADQAEVLVVRRDSLPPFMRRQIERTGEIADIAQDLDLRSIPRIHPVGSYHPDNFDSFKATARITEQSVLTGKRDLIAGVPRKAASSMSKAGMDNAATSTNRRMYQAIEGMTPQAARELRTVVDDALPGMVGSGLNIGVTDDVASVHFALDPSVTDIEADQLRERALHQLDNAFTDGELKGRLNNETMMQLFENAPNNESSDLLYKFFKNRMASLNDQAREFLGKNPGEFVETTVLADDFYEGVNSFINSYAGLRAQSTGELIQGGRQAQLLAGKQSQVMKDLKDLRKAARELGDRGYDEAVEVMRRVDDWTGVADVPGFIRPSDLGIGGPAVEGMQIQRNIGLWLKNVGRNTASIYTPEGVAAARTATRTLLRTWRALATLPRPAFHIRNAMGAGWMNMAAGVEGETYRALGTNGLRWKKALREGIADPFSVIDDDLQGVWHAMVEQDILGGFVTSEFRTPLSTLEKNERLGWLNVFDPEKFIATRVGGRAMESIEDVARAALFMQYYQEGVEGSAIAAKEVVRAIHFDYNDLTPWETKIKSVIPFFVWTRRNLPRQIEMMVERPMLVRRYEHMLQSLNDNFGGNDENGLPTGDLFGAVAAGTDIYVNPGTPFWARVMIDPDLPTSDLLNLPGLDPGQIAEFANNLAGPHVTALFDINEQREFGDVNAPAPMNFILKGLAAIGLFDEAIGGDVRIPYWMRTVQETALPFSRDLIDPLTGGPTDPNRQQRLGVKEDDNPVEAGLKSLLSSLGRGVGIKYNTPVDVRSATARSQDDLNKIIRDLRDQGILPPSGSQSNPFG